MRRLLRFAPAAVLGLTIALAPMNGVRAAVVGADANIVLASPMQQAEPVTTYNASTQELATLDPQVAQENLSINWIENLFLGLTDIDPATTQIRPEMATDWTQSESGDVWTFNLRDDVYWVRYDPGTQEFEQLRLVTAQDFVYGIRRGCDPRAAGAYLGVVAAMIQGCDLTANADPNSLTDADFEQIGVRALSDTQLEITTRGVLPYFLSASGMWILRAVPQETIEEFGEAWTEVGNIVTNGPFAPVELDNNVIRRAQRNPFYPFDEINDSYGGNVEFVQTIIVGDGGTIYSLYQNNEIETTGVPQAELQRIREDAELSQELYQTSDLTVFYYGFAVDKAPFDNVHVRRAFSAMLDRQTYIQDLVAGRGVPMAHFMPPGIRGSVPINEVGIGQPDTPGYDPEYAREQIAEAGFPNCEGFPDVTILTVAGNTDDVEYIKNAARTVLGCDPAVFATEEAQFSVFLTLIDPQAPSAQRPHMFAGLGWGPDYPDAHNWVHDVLGCRSTLNHSARPCDEEIDGLIDAAATNLDGRTRDEQYRQVEELFFGPEGEFPIAPMFLRVNLFMIKPWFSYNVETDGLFGGIHWDTYRIDQKLQLAARP
jgi:oligopeptide transport system substrate-binding protein